MLDFDLQAGPLHGSSEAGDHVVLPDFEIGLGVTRNVEVDVSGAFSIDQLGGQRQLSGEALWLATKLGLLDTQTASGDDWALGLELGPRLPTIAAAGVGYGALWLLGFTHGPLGVVLNAGTLIDPGVSVSSSRATSLVLGLDLNCNLDPRGKWSVQSELGVAHYLSSDPDELAFTFGATYAVDPALDVSLTALTGFLPNTDRVGLLLGVSPQFAMW